MPAAMPSAGGAIQPVADTAAAAAAGTLAERANRLASAAFQMSGPKTPKPQMFEINIIKNEYIYRIKSSKNRH